MSMALQLQKDKYSYCFILGGYKMVTSGSNCNRITSKTVCEKASIDLGLSDNVAENEYDSSFPPYCALWQNGDDYELIFNHNGDSNKGCSTHEPCICYDGKVECQ